MRYYYDSTKMIALCLITTPQWLPCHTYWAVLPLLCTYLTFLRIPVSPGGKELCCYSCFSSQSTESSGGTANHSQGSTYFSFRPTKQQDFPGNVSMGGCDSLPIVFALTSKHHDSRLCYALHFLYIISLRKCRYFGLEPKGDEAPCGKTELSP